MRLVAKRKVGWASVPVRVLLSLSCTLLALPAAAHAHAADPTVRVLPNGLRVVVREQRAVPLAAIDVWVRAGSGAEGPAEAGAAHVLEHMLFKGTPTRRPGEIDFAIETLGGILNAGTVRDSAHVYTTVPVAHLGEALDVIADMVRSPAIDAVELTRERAVVLDELARDRNDTRLMATDMAMTGAFWGLPDANPPAGNAETVAQVSREAVAAFHERLYVPANSVVVIVGDVDVEAAANLVAKRFGDWKGPDAGLAPAASAPHASAGTPASRRLEVDPAGRRAAPDRRTGICIVLRPGGAPTVEQYLALRLAACLLVANDLGRAKDALAKVGGESLAADVVPAASGLALAVYGEVKGRSVDEGMAALEAEMARLGGSPLSQDDLETARRRLMSRHLAEMETYEGQARALARFALLGDPAACVQLDARLAKLDAAAFRRTFATAAPVSEPGEAIVPLPRWRVGR